MDYTELTEEQEALLDDAERIVRREKLRDFLNSPKDFFRKKRCGYYDDRLVYALRWLAAQPPEDDEYYE